jgi:hypothetical protein
VGCYNWSGSSIKAYQITIAAESHTSTYTDQLQRTIQCEDAARYIQRGVDEHRGTIHEVLINTQNRESNNSTAE